MISTRKTFHIAYDEALEQWILTYTAADQPFSAHTTKDDAVQAGRELANNQQPSRADHPQNGRQRADRVQLRRGALPGRNVIPFLKVTMGVLAGAACQNTHYSLIPYN